MVTRRRIYRKWVPDSHGLLEALKTTYVMADTQVIHAGASVAKAQQGEAVTCS
jgi:hypothetical protein